MNNGREQKPKKKPVFSVFTVTKRNGRDIWRNEGVTFAHKDPEEGLDAGLEVLEGMNQLIYMFGQEIKLVLLPYKEPQKTEQPQEQPASTPESLVVQ